MAKVQITETAFRDAHQSLIATRMTTDEILPIAELMDQVGYYSLEMWGGATFDSCLRFLNEDPWERLRKVRRRVKNTKLQMLLRGQNILGYKHYPDDVLIEFVKKAVGNGIDIIRIFDALNDIRNLETAMAAIVKEGAHAQAAFSYTISPIHNIQHYIETAKKLESMGASSICIKDMAGLLKPYTAYELVMELKKAVNIPIDVHSHYTSGLASMTYMKAIEAGADIVDCAISPVAMGTSQPPTEPLVASLKETPFDTGLDMEILNEIAGYFKPLREKYLKSGLLDPKVLSVDVNALIYQVPGGMLSNLVSQLKQQGKEDKLDEVLQEVPRVREDLGYPPLVTPTSQIVGTQAVLNVITGERYKMVTKETKAYVRGEYGRPPVEIKKEIQHKLIGDEEPITCRPADLIKPALKEYRDAIKGYMEQEEDVLSYALFPQVAESYFKYRQAEKYKIDSTQVSYSYQIHPV
ncbi:MAG TPA: oxaloacetate decarboxylase subunit alpha [Clostridiales bacterium]|nr:oxaloacetate decarboxylase subunit alpha [Clostridiales bacterium]